MNDAYCDLIQHALDGGPDNAGQKIASAQSSLDTLIADLSNPVTVAEYAGYERELMSIVLATDLVRGAAKSDWPERAKLRVVR